MTGPIDQIPQPLKPVAEEKVNRQLKSDEWYARSKKLAPAGVHSPVRAFRAVGGSPIFFEKGAGSHLWDVDGNEYVDYCMSWGALAVGHAHPDVVKAIVDQATLGTHYGTPTPQDVKLAEKVIPKLAPYEKLRFVSSGTEAVMTAIRLARGFTGKNKILKVEGTYHGHVDALLVSAGSGLITFGNTFSAGVPPGIVQDTIVIPYNSFQALDETFEKFGSEIAAIIVEPIMANNGLFEFERGFLERCRELTLRYKALLIFDEVITGFRVNWGGSMAHYQMEPDIGTYGKILGGGLPVGAVAARSEIMESLAPNGKVYQAGTLSGNPIAMAAGLATLTAMENNDHFEKVKVLAEYMDEKIAEIQSRNLKIPLFYRRVEGMFWLCPGDAKAPVSPSAIGDRQREAFKAIYHRILEQGVYISPSVFEIGFISSVHSKDDIDQLTKAIAIASN